MGPVTSRRRASSTIATTSSKSQTLKKAGISGGTGAALSGLALNLPDNWFRSLVLVASPLVTVLVGMTEARIGEIVNDFFEDREVANLTKRAEENLKRLSEYENTNQTLIDNAKATLDGCHTRATELINERLARHS